MSAPVDKDARKAEATQLAITEGLKGAGIATVGVGAFHFSANSLWPAYRNLRGSPKYVLLTAVVVAAFAIRGEEAQIKRAREMAAEDERATAAADKELLKARMAIQAQIASGRAGQQAAKGAAGNSSSGDKQLS